MAEKRSFKGLIERAKQSDDYWVGKAIHDFTEDLYALMEARAISKAELAKLIGSTPAYVTKVLRGNTNFTIGSMVRIVRALDGQLCIHVGRREDDVRWFDIVGRPAAPLKARSEGFELISKSYVRGKAPLEVDVDEPDPAAA